MGASVLASPCLTRGTSYLAVTADGGDPVLRVKAHGAPPEEHAVPVKLDPLEAHAALTAVRTPISVLIRRDGGNFSCTLIGTSANGPRRVPVSLGAALEIARRGVHCVLRDEGAELADAS
jgi:hypothetical protein